MSFNGFSEKTLEYFLQVCLDNSKSCYEIHKQQYNDHVKTPLCELHEALVPIMQEIDQTICIKQTRCVSGAFNDARFSRSDPIKTYMYLHFCAETGRETDIPGFFMDASYDGYRFGLQIYHRTTQGMTMLRDAVIKKDARFYQIINKLENEGLFQLEGDTYKKDHFPAAPPELKNWLNRKSWLLCQTAQPDDAFLSRDFVKLLSEGFFPLGEIYRFILEGLR